MAFGDKNITAEYIKNYVKHCPNRPFSSEESFMTEEWIKEYCEQFDKKIREEAAEHGKHLKDFYAYLETVIDETLEEMIKERIENVRRDTE